MRIATEVDLFARSHWPSAGSKVEVTDPDVIRTLLTLPRRSFSHAGGAYLVRVLGAPGWYDAEETARHLAQMAQAG